MTCLRTFGCFALFALVSAGCGSDADPIVGSAVAKGGAAGQGGVSGKGGTTSVGAGTGTTTPRKYATDDEGVFPKDRVLDIQVTMSDAAYTQMIATAEQEIWSTADVTIDDQKLGAIGIRPKGAYSLDSCVDDTGKLLCDKLSLKLKFNHVDADERFYGLKKLALNQITDSGSVFMETLSYQVFNDFGIVAPRTSYATVTVNGKSQGLFTVVETIDGRFTDRHFSGGNGNLYKEAWPDRTDETHFARAIETNEETATHEVAIAFAKDMLGAADDKLEAALSKYMDVRHLLDYMAVDYAIANWDGITTFYAGDWGHTNHNFYLYQDETEPKFTLIPWDLNATFFLDHWLGDIKPWDAMDVDCVNWIPTQDTPDLFTIPATCDPMIRTLALAKTEYHESVQRLLDEVFIVARLNAALDKYLEQVSPALTADPSLTLSEVTGVESWMKGQVTLMRSRLEAVLKQ